MSAESEADQLSNTNARVPAWGALAYPDFRLFWAHGVLQGVSRHMREMLTFFLVWDLSGSAVQLGVTGLFQAVPIILFGLLGGALADSINRKKMLLATQGANLVSAGLLTALVFTDVVAVWHLWLLSSFWSAVNSLNRPSQRAYMPKLVPPSHIVNAVTWYGSLSQGTLFIGPIIAGFLVAWVGIGWAFLANVIVLGLAWFATVAIRASGAPEGSSRRASIRTVWEGVSFIRSKDMLLASYLMDFGVMSVGFFRPLMPILALEVFEVGVEGLGVLNAAPAIGSVLGTGALLIMGNIRRKGVVIVLAYFAYACGLAILGMAPWFGLAIGALALLGFMDVVSFTAKQAMIQIVAPDNYRGRAASLSSIMSGTGNATGAMEMGALAAVAGAPGALIINSAIGVGIAAVITLRWMGLWRYDERS